MQGGIAHLHMVLNDGGQERVVSFAAGASFVPFFVLSLFAEASSTSISGSDKIDALLMELKQAKEVVSRTQAAM